MLIEYLGYQGTHGKDGSWWDKDMVIQMIQLHPFSHWNAAKALAHVSKVYGANEHVSVCKAIILHGCLLWYRNSVPWKIQQKRNIRTEEQDTEDDITLTREAVTEVMSFKKRKGEQVTAMDTNPNQLMPAVDISPLCRFHLF